ncbi:MAG: hypothetical protein Q7K54_01030 [Candidatus Parcubacteria bacterium]|nr:hypothetical protein [Candidatus Parcubacteria bacterium]
MCKTFFSQIVIILFLIFVAGMAKGVSDTLQFHYPKSVFTTIQGHEQYWNPAISWKNKYRDYDHGDAREAFIFSRSLLVWLTDAWHLAQTIQTLAWTLALVLTLRLGYKNGATKQYSIIELCLFFLFIYISFYLGFVFLYDWALII